MKKRIAAFLVIMSLIIVGIISCKQPASISYYLAFTVDTTDDFRVVMSGNVNQALNSLDLSPYMMSYISKIPGGARGYVMNVESKGKFGGFSGMAVNYDTTIDDVCEFNVSPKDLTTDSYQFLFSVMHYESDPYQLVLIQPIIFTNVIPMVRKGDTFSLNLPGPYDAVMVASSGGALVQIRDIVVRAYTYSERCENSPEITAYSPGDEDTGVSTTPTITITFSKAMDPSVTDLYVNDELVQGIWQNGNTELVYSVTAALPSGADINVDVPETHISGDGYPFPTPQSITFTTL